MCYYLRLVSVWVVTCEEVCLFIPVALNPPLGKDLIFLLQIRNNDAMFVIKDLERGTLRENGAISNILKCIKTDSQSQFNS